MTTEVRLCTKHSDFTELHQQTLTRKAVVTVNKEVLEKLLTDHSIMAKAIKGNSSFKLIEPALRERVKLTTGA